MSTDSGTAETSGSASPADVFASIRGTRDSLSVSRAYGDPYDLDGVTVIPVARVSGGAGGGGGEGSDDEGSTGGGFGTGFGLHVNPIGVYEVRGDHVEWKPALDVARLARGGQILAGVIAVCLTFVAVARARSR
jgi:uncharacterized spore protein YtfJ